jgi:hypothetical protein
MAIDYTDFTRNGKKVHASKSRGKATQRWWLSEKSGIHQDVISAFQMIYEYPRERMRQQQYAISNRLYGNHDLYGINDSYSISANPINRISYNICQSATDTLTSKACKSTPKTMFATSGADYKLQAKAKNLEKFVDGIFYENQFYTSTRARCAKDAIIFGDGLAKVFTHNGRPAIERVNPRRVFVDWLEAMDGNPRQKFEYRLLDRDVLIELYPEFTDQIKAAMGIPFSTWNLTSPNSDTIFILEAWHLPSGQDASDGRHVIVLDNCTLVDEEWTKPTFPFAKFPFNTLTDGYWSQGGVEQIQATQLEINKIMWKISRSLDLAATFKIWLKTGSRLPKEHLNNELGTILSSDEPPQYIVPPIIQPEIYQRLETLKREGFEIFGISQLSAQSQKPAGLDSGKALRTYANIEAERFTTFGKSDEAFILQCSALIVDNARDIVETEGSLEVKAYNKRVVDAIDFKDNDLEESDYIMQMFPVSSLPTDPSGRFQQIQEYMQAGLINQRTGKRLLDFPDLESAEELSNSREDYLHKVYCEIISDAKWVEPEPEDDLMLAQELFLDYYAMAKKTGVEQEKLEMLIRFNDQTKNLMNIAAQAAQPQQAMPQVPQGQALPPPTSDLLPQGG